MVVYLVIVGLLYFQMLEIRCATWLIEHIIPFLPAVNEFLDAGDDQAVL